MENKKDVAVANNISKFIKVVIGIVFLGVGVFAIIQWWDFLIALFKGSCGLFFILAGIIFLAIARE